ncbi:4,5-DOPA dioxygenase extradiol [Ottowia caeni]|uniref:4,5-DOPA-extradiol-dioxygenase n=1 Tax=Ottowia caeni TaxID=2870339 RepID=UPI001E585BAD|nr:4,5-DOPA dioxygenase extradiol [Ottowia caeni]
MTSRRLFLETTAISGVSAALLALTSALQAQAASPKRTRQPVLFIGHGSPMNAIRTNAFTSALSNWGKRLQAPTAILVVSAHWLTRGATGITANEQPPTIHDFSGFPRQLHEMRYPAKGHPELALAAAKLIKSNPSVPTTQWGLDHGTWTVLHHLFPDANVPVFQVSIDYDKPGAFHYAVGRELQALRDQGVLIIGSGNIVHNLRATDRGTPDSKSASRPWAQAFDASVKAALDQREDKALQAYLALDESAKMAVPTPDHYWPLIYALGAAGDTAPTHVFEEFHSGTISMRCLQFA